MISAMPVFELSLCCSCITLVNMKGPYVCSRHTVRYSAVLEFKFKGEKSGKKGKHLPHLPRSSPPSPPHAGGEISARLDPRDRSAKTGGE